MVYLYHRLTISESIIIRNGPNSEKITSIERMLDFFQQSDRIFFDEAICKGFSYPDDFDSKAFESFLQKGGITATLSIEQLLLNLSLTNDIGQLTNGAALFFPKDIQRLFYHAIVRCILFKGPDKHFILDSKEMKGNLVEQFDSHCITKVFVLFTFPIFMLITYVPFARWLTEREYIEMPLLPFCSLLNSTRPLMSLTLKVIC